MWLCPVEWYAKKCLPFEIDRHGHFSFAFVCDQFYIFETITIAGHFSKNFVHKQVEPLHRPLTNTFVKMRLKQRNILLRREWKTDEKSWWKCTRKLISSKSVLIKEWWGECLFYCGSVLDRAWTWINTWMSESKLQETKLLVLLLLLFLFLDCLLFCEGCGCSSSRLSRHTSRSFITCIISLGWSPKRFHPRSSI